MDEQDLDQIGAGKPRLTADDIENQVMWDNLFELSESYYEGMPVQPGAIEMLQRKMLEKDRQITFLTRAVSALVALSFQNSQELYDEWSRRVKTNTRY